MRGENTPERKVASTGDRTHNHQVMSPPRSPLSHPGGADCVSKGQQHDMYLNLLSNFSAVSKEGKVKGEEPIFDFGEEVRELAGQYDFMENLDKLDTKLPLPKKGE